MTTAQTWCAPNQKAGGNLEWYLRKGRWASREPLSEGVPPAPAPASEVLGAAAGRDTSMDAPLRIEGPGASTDEARRVAAGGGRCAVRASHSTKKAFTSGSTCAQG